MNLLDGNILYLTELLKNNTNIKEINLAWNDNLTEKSIDYLIELLNNNNNIEKIRLDHSLDYESFLIVNKKLRENVI